MHPILFRLGTFPIGTYGLLLALGFVAGTALARRMGRGDQLPGEAITDLAVALLLAGILGSKLLMVIVDLIQGAPLSEVFSMGTLRAGGAIHGGLIAGAVTFFWKVRGNPDLPLRATADALAPGVALGQAIGRLGCFAAGCCYGTTCDLPWAVTYTHPESGAAHTAFFGVPLHPVQVYTTLLHLGILGILLGVRRARRWQGQVFSAWMVLEGLGRIFIEHWRGDLDRGVWMSLPWLSTGRITGVIFMAFGALLWWAWRPKATETA